MIRKILLAYDGSEPAAKAFRFSADLAKRYGAELHVLTVAQTPEFGDEVETEAVIGMPTASQAGHSLGTGFCMNRPCSRISRT